MSKLPHCLLFALLSASPSCLTAHMWSRYEPVWTASNTMQAERGFERRGVLFCATDDEFTNRQSLIWDHEGTEPGTARRTKLVAADDAAVRLPTILRSRNLTIARAGLATDILADNGRVWRSSTLQVAFRFAPGSLGKLLVPKTLPQTCADSMCSADSASILPRNDELSNLRLLMARGVGLDSSWRLEAWQVTDETFTPINAAEPRRALQQANQGAMFVGRFLSPNGVAFGVVPGPVAALFAGSTVECTADGVCLHTSRWLPQSTTDPQLAATYLVLGPIVERVQRVDQWTHDSFAIDGNFFARVLLTPITIACDVALGPDTVRLWQAITGELPPRPLPPEFWNAARESQRQRAGSRGQD